MREAFYISQRKFGEWRARVGRLEDERAAAAAQAAARIVERAAEVVEEQLAVLQEVERDRLVPSSDAWARRGRRTVVLCVARHSWLRLAALKCYVRRLPLGCVKII